MNVLLKNDKYYDQQHSTAGSKTDNKLPYE